MATGGDPPEGRRSGGDDEYRSVVFDESFVEAARLQEYSAQERLREDSRPVRDRRPWSSLARSPRQGIVMVLLIMVAFGTAIYLGVRSPYTPPERRAEPMRSTVIPLAPKGAVPGSNPRDLFRHSPAAHYRSGAAGVALPRPRPTENFSQTQVLSALALAKEYVVESSMDQRVLNGRAAAPVRRLLDPDQRRQFDTSLRRPSGDGRHAATGWLVRFDPSTTRLADPAVRVRGTLFVREGNQGTLEVTADHVLVYAVQPATGQEGKGTARVVDRDGDDKPDASLFTVRREIRMQFTRDDLRDRHLNVRQTAVRAGPMACSTDPSGVMRPLLAGQRAKDDRSAGTDPFDRDPHHGSLCGVMADSAQPHPRH
ncbi:hypothetical protein [Streptomyces sp. NPDC005438]|uniref:SCO2583 family membrane protein n=1 Tax=Streptomyces sp. NPDC005438 TaxID=3156880 RepID=UPI00339EE449